MIITKSPFNYIGNKYRILKTMMEFFPRSINTMVDLFCGGCDVVINTHARIRYANDINFFVIEICREFQNYHIDDILLYYIDRTIDDWRLTKEDSGAYLRFRDYYNRTKNPLDLYTLICFSFNYQFRFNSSYEYNNPFGKNRSSFNGVMRSNLIEFKRRIKEGYIEPNNHSIAEKTLLLPTLFSPIKTFTQLLTSISIDLILL